MNGTAFFVCPAKRANPVAGTGDGRIPILDRYHLVFYYSFIMNKKKLKAAEIAFLDHYPGGFFNPIMVERGKKYKGEKLSLRAREVFQKERFDDIIIVSENIIKTATYSAMVSVFEKPKFRDFVRGLSGRELGRLTATYYQLLHEDMERGFTELVALLDQGKCAKWTLVTVCPFYFRPRDEVFVKPTTTKNIIDYFEIPGLVYKARPTWEFYTGYRAVIREMKALVNPCLSPDSAAFTAFLMLAMEM